jgi:hypothetical protein
MFGNLNPMSLEELVGRLQVAEDADTEEQEATNGGHTEKLLLTEEQWKRRGGVSAARSGRTAVARVVAAAKREAEAAAVEMPAKTTTTGRVAFVPVRAGAVTAPARGGASTVVFTATSPGSAPNQGRRRRCSSAPTTRQHSYRAGHVAWFRERILE